MNGANINPYRFCVAPMMDGTDRHCRYLHRLLSRRARLYTEMIVVEAILRGDAARHLEFDPVEHPVALQIGGSEPKKLAEAARLGEAFGYDEVNLNVGCPSDRVQSGTFGACLMKAPALVADCVAQMRAAARIPVTVKCRIGVDDQDPEESLFEFVNDVAEAGCEVFIVHARKAWLKGLSPKENREVPPLDYELVARLKESRPDLAIVLNGGVSTLDQCAAHLERFDGVMLGRAAYGDPYMLAHVDGALFGDHHPIPTREEAARAMIPYLQRLAGQGRNPWRALRHMLGLFHGTRGARAWRRILSRAGTRAGPEVIEEALAAIAAPAPVNA